MFASLDHCALTPPPFRPLAPPQSSSDRATTMSVTPRARQVVGDREPHDPGADDDDLGAIVMGGDLNSTT